MGSSTLMMCSLLVWLILSIIAAERGGLAAARRPRDRHQAARLIGHALHDTE